MNSLKKQLIEPGTEDALRRLQGKITGRVMTVIDPLASGTIIRVLPTALQGGIPAGRDDIVWANIFWNGFYHICMIYNVSPNEDGGAYRTLKGALRKARKTVSLYNQQGPRPPKGWTVSMQKNIGELISVVASEQAIKSYQAMTADYWQGVEHEMLNELEEEFWEDPDEPFQEYSSTAWLTW